MNFGVQDYKVAQHDRVAQLIVEGIAYPEVTEVKALPKETERGQGGFGSTGS